MVTNAKLDMYKKINPKAAKAIKRAKMYPKLMRRMVTLNLSRSKFWGDENPWIMECRDANIRYSDVKYAKAAFKFCETEE